jgi:hypothetical protein
MRPLIVGFLAPICVPASARAQSAGEISGSVTSVAISAVSGADHPDAGHDETLTGW